MTWAKPLCAARNLRITERKLSDTKRVTIPMLSALVPDGGTVLLVESDPESQWFELATTINPGKTLSDTDSND
jgi:hypothetical protein